MGQVCGRGNGGGYLTFGGGFANGGEGGGFTTGGGDLGLGK